MSIKKKALQAAAGAAGAEPGPNIEDLFYVDLWTGLDGSDSFYTGTALLTDSELQGDTATYVVYNVVFNNLGTRTSTFNNGNRYDLFLESTNGGGSSGGGNYGSVRQGIYYANNNPLHTFHSVDVIGSTKSPDRFGGVATFDLGNVSDITEIANEYNGDFSAVTTIASGDLIILYEWEQEAQLTSATLPSGFTEIFVRHESGTYGASERLAVKIADGTENGTNYGRNCLLTGGFPKSRAIAIRAGTGTFNSAAAMATSAKTNSTIQGVYQLVNNNFDYINNDALVVVKNRERASGWRFVDTVRGSKQTIFSDSTSAELDRTSVFFGNGGFTVGDYPGTNDINEGVVGWTFKKQPKFLDIVTYTGNGSTQEIAHNLESTPGCIFVKRRNSTDSWRVYHRSLDVNSDGAPETDYLVLNTTAAAGDFPMWNDTAPTSTTFSVGNESGVNASGSTYVAYLFAHNDNDGGFGPNGNQDIIKCGGYTGTGTTPLEVDIGFEPQFIIIKEASDTGNWRLVDTTRGWYDGDDDAVLVLNATTTEAGATFNAAAPKSNGIKLEIINADINASGQKYIYIAVRRGPMALPTSGNDLLRIVERTGTGGSASIYLGAPQMYPDFFLSKAHNQATYNPILYDKLRNDAYLLTSTGDVSSTGGLTAWKTSGGFGGVQVTGGSTFGLDGSGDTIINWFLKRYPGVFDIVTYRGTGVAGRTVPHNLTVAPELMFVKNRSNTANWLVYSAAVGAGSYGVLSGTNKFDPAIQAWNNTAPDATAFTLGTYSNVNASGDNYVAYLFASLDGISKVGSYTGNGTNQTIDCGFTTGARFLLIKRTDTTGDWYVWDSTRGIVAGDDPHLSLNTTAVEVTNDDSVDPDSSGFIVNQVAATNINVSSANYIFLAIA